MVMNRNQQKAMFARIRGKRTETKFAIAPTGPIETFVIPTRRSIVKLSDSDVRKIAKDRGKNFSPIESSIANDVLASRGLSTPSIERQERQTLRQRVKRVK